MSSVKIGKISPFPPLPGQPYPPARNHPRWKELYRLHDEWLVKYWPFSSEKKRNRIPCMNLAGFSTWCAPASDFDRMVWGGIIAGIFFLADDYVDTAKMMDRIPGFKQAATGNGPLHPEDRAELCHDIVFRAIKATGHPRTFNQLTQCTHEWWDSNIHEPFRNLDQYLGVRRVNIAMYFANAYFRYTLDINLTDEQVNHPLMREAEGIVSDHVGLVNDYFSYLKETMTNSDDTNILRLLQDYEGLTYEEAKVVVEQKIRQKERDYIPAGMAVLNHPELGKDPEVRRWIASLPYCMGGNMAWSQESGRYNVGDSIPGAPSFPSLSYAAEETPADEIVDDTEETILRNRWFSKGLPPVDFSLDSEAIEGGSVRTDTQSKIIPRSLTLATRVRPRPQDVGIKAMDVYIPRRCISQTELEAFDGASKGKYTIGLGQEYLAYLDDREDINSIALSTVAALIKKYNIDPQTIGYLEVGTETILDKSKSVKTVLMELFKESGNMDIGGVDSKNGCYGSTAALFNAINWIESNSWDGRNAIVFAGDIAVYSEGSARPVGGAGAVAMLIGPNAPLVVEASRGNYMDNIYDFYKPNLESEYPIVDGPLTVTTYLTALDESFSSYKRKRTQELAEIDLNGHLPNGTSGRTSEPNGTHGINGTNGASGTNGVNGINGAKGANGAGSDGHNKEPVISITEFDYMIYHSPYGKMVQKAHARLHYNEYLANPEDQIYACIPAAMKSSSKKASLNDKGLEQAFMKLAAADYQERVAPSMAISKRCGNMYTGSLYGGLASLIDALPSYLLFEKRISMFAYGSGCASSFFVVRVKGDTMPIRNTMNLRGRLNDMRVTSCEEYVKAMKLREKNHNKAPYTPFGSLNDLWPGSYYLESICERSKRHYAIA